jgi:hypothetical protein
MNPAHREEFSLSQALSNARGVAEFEIMKKWKWLFVNTCECKSLFSTAPEIFKRKPVWDKCIVVFGGYGENNDTSVE